MTKTHKQGKQMKKRQRHHERKARLNRLYTSALCGFLAFLLYFLVIIVALAIFSGCAKVVEKEVLVPYEVSIPVPMKCQYQMPKEIIPQLNSMQEVSNSLLEILKQDKEIRQSLGQIPCLDLE